TRTVPGWWHRWRSLVGEAWRFGVVGATNVVINFVVFNALALTLFSGGELKANIVATVFATTSSYLLNRGWTFRHRKTSRSSREYVLFFVFNAAGLAIELAVMGAAKYGLGLTGLWALNVAKGAGLGLGTVFRFWTYRTFVFDAVEPPAGSGASGDLTGETGSGSPAAPAAVAESPPAADRGAGTGAGSAANPGSDSAAVPAADPAPIRP